jgi:D-alanyl-D-alanine carboxypeptidase/D-alanyl-D-alanine-endopeptidase (penicillin-binding protein 4)
MLAAVGLAWALAQAAPPDLKARLDGVLAPLVAEADITPGVRLERLDGTLLYERRGSEAFVIASNMKLFTTAAALLALGPDYRWSSTGILDGTRLWLSSTGDPSLRRIGERDVPAAFLDGLAKALRGRGISALSEVVLDASAFSGPARHPLWPADQWQADYCAPVAALALEGGCLEILEAGGRLSAYPSAGSAWRWERKSAADAKSWTANWNGARDAIVVRGSGAGKAPLRLAVADPAPVFAGWIEEGLRARGIPAAAVRYAAAGEKAPDEQPLIVLKSAWTLAEALTVCNKESDNFLAEVLLRTLGRERGGAGSNEAGVAAVRKILAMGKLDLTTLNQADGSGLARSETERVNTSSPALLCHVLRLMAGPAGERGGIGCIFRDSLPVAGLESKLRGPFDDAIFQPARVRAKTGWIRGASSLAGYLTMPDGEVLCFAIVINYRSDGTARTNNARFRRAQADLLEEVLRAWPAKN